MNQTRRSFAYKCLVHVRGILAAAWTAVNYCLQIDCLRAWGWVCVRVSDESDPACDAGRDAQSARDDNVRNIDCEFVRGQNCIVSERLANLAYL